MPTAKAGYRLASGEKVPSVTTILSRFKESGALVAWAYRKGREHENLAMRNLPAPAHLHDEVGKAAEIGTLAHSWCEADIRGEPLPEVPEDCKKYVESAFDAYLTWKRQTKCKIVYVEVGMVSERWRFGGTLDFICEIEGKLCMGDFKTSKSVYADHLLQLAAYRTLWNETHPNEPLLGGSHLLRIAKEDGDFAHHYYPDLSTEWEQFRLFREAYDLDAKIKKRAA